MLLEVYDLSTPFGQSTSFNFRIMALFSGTQESCQRGTGRQEKNKNEKAPQETKRKSWKSQQEMT